MATVIEISLYSHLGANKPQTAWVPHPSQNSTYFQTGERVMGIAFTFAEILVYNTITKKRGT